MQSPRTCSSTGAILSIALLWAALSIFFIIVAAIVPALFTLTKGHENFEEVFLGILLNIFKVFILIAFLYGSKIVALVFLAFLAYVAGVAELVGLLYFHDDQIDNGMFLALLFFTGVGVLIQTALLLSDVTVPESRALKHQSAAVEPLHP